MKTFNDFVQDEIANLISDLRYPSGSIYDTAAKKYALQVAEDLRERCAQNADDHMVKVQGIYCFDQMSVLNTEIILP